ncbi:hypothetical protein C5L30_000228 [Companilactobacillus farciminis]|uniref:BppU N-terminal domain-containing protein n=1 Tax=Companilactobacillus farciminis TaxID=1612 RepID=A0A4R5NIV9_9LACO|nr:hypothetical protein [Companilactobacillus farciminis]ATO46117.1 phage tail protein [Companilactobacillus farciminis KCTC 3681 = DSM 20184]KRK62502.1 hypothetical protein FC68_GL002032 [Companilactobacillus farciminis KCTC 3681 = DSM 20184]TDG74512.1 hypothetical protein C5L30_000228 [Companilactobacillus farciminis]
MALPPIILDTNKTTPIYELPLKIRQGDTGDELQVTLGKSFEKYTDLSTVDVELIAKTPDQRLIKQPVTDKSKNTFKVKFPDEMYTNVGVFRNMYFKIGDDSTSSVKLVVLQGIGSIKEAGSYIDDFETLIKEAESYVLALKDFADTENAKIDNKVAELTGKMQSFVDQAQKDLNAAKAVWNTFQSNSETSFTTAQDKRTSDFDSQKAGFETDFNEQQTDFENRFKALLATLQGDYDNFKALINKDVKDFNTSLDSLDSQATDVKNKFDALKAQLDLAAQNISGVRTNLIVAKTIKNYSTLDNGITFGYAIAFTTDYIPVMANKKYTISIYGTANSVVSRISYYDSSKSFIKKEHDGKISTSSSEVIAVPPEISYIRFSPDTPDKSGEYKNNFKIELGPTATDYSLNPKDIATDGSVQTAIINALDKADYSTNAEVDKKISTGVGQAKTYAEQTIKGIIGAAPETLDTIAELADAVTENKDGVQAINDGITKKADKTEVTALQNTVQTMITPISQEDYKALEDAGTVDPKIMYVIPDA